ncbi:hypothetical protein [Streptomyces sp. DH37]|uniref:hypothetical protein n=1 Tax=Streptomyces sp. DH37 TaxID=3040122 RepID=UPI00301444FE
MLNRLLVLGRLRVLRRLGRLLVLGRLRVLRRLGRLLVRRRLGRPGGDGLSGLRGRLLPRRRLRPPRLPPGLPRRGAPLGVAVAGGPRITIRRQDNTLTRLVALSAVRRHRDSSFT